MIKPYIVTGDCQVSTTNTAVVRVVVIAESPRHAKRLAGEFVKTAFGQQGFTDELKLTLTPKSGNTEALLVAFASHAKV